MSTIPQNSASVHKTTVRQATARPTAVRQNSAHQSSVHQKTPNSKTVSGYTFFNEVLGYARMGTVISAAILCVSLLTLVSFVNIRIKGIQATCWTVLPFARIACAIFDFKVTCPDVERLKGHKGIIVANHSSFLDILTLIHYMPIRFLAAIEVKRRPFIGKIATMAGVIFVTREDMHSRHVATSEIVRALKEQPDLPIIIFPEGRIGEGRLVGEFFHGAFRIAARQNVPLLPCAIEYMPEEVAVWDGEGESFNATIWPVVKHTGGVRAVITPLEPIHLQPDADIEQVAFETRREIAQTLGFQE